MFSEKNSSLSESEINNLLASYKSLIKSDSNLDLSKLTTQSLSSLIQKTPEFFNSLFSQLEKSVNLFTSHTIDLNTFGESGIPLIKFLSHLMFYHKLTPDRSFVNSLYDLLLFLFQFSELHGLYIEFACSIIECLLCTLQFLKKKSEYIQTHFHHFLDFIKWFSSFPLINTLGIPIKLSIQNLTELTIEKFDILGYVLITIFSFVKYYSCSISLDKACLFLNDLLNCISKNDEKCIFDDDSLIKAFNFNLGLKIFNCLRFCFSDRLLAIRKFEEKIEKLFVFAGILLSSAELDDKKSIKEDPGQLGQLFRTGIGLFFNGNLSDPENLNTLVAKILYSLVKKSAEL